MHRGFGEFSFRWKGRLLSDNERRTLAVQHTGGKRLFLVKPHAPRARSDARSRRLRELVQEARHDFRNVLYPAQSVAGWSAVLSR